MEGSSMQMAATTTTATAAAPSPMKVGMTNALSWTEVQEICDEMEKLFRKDAHKDTQRLRAVAQKRRQIAATVASKRSESSKKLQHLLSNVKEWEEHEAAIQRRHEQMQLRAQELEALKRDVTAQLERLRESLEKLLDKYEETRLAAAQFELLHQHDIPFAKHQMSLYASVTGIKWDFSAASVAGEIIVPSKQLVSRFEIDPTAAHFEAANTLWDKIDAAFDDDEHDETVSSNSK